MLITNQIDTRIKQRNITDLILSPVIIRVNSFNEAGAKEFVENINKAHDTGQTIIPVIIDSYGGEVYSLLAMVDAIKASKLPVATIVEGKAMSCGAVLFSFGTENYRYMGRMATLMIHDVSTGAHNKIKEVEMRAEEGRRLNDMLYKMMAQNIGKHDDYILDLIHEQGHADWYLNPTEAKEHGLCNHIRIPEFQTQVTVASKLL